MCVSDVLIGFSKNVAMSRHAMLYKMSVGVLSVHFFLRHNHTHTHTHYTIAVVPVFTIYMALHHDKGSVNH